MKTNYLCVLAVVVMLGFIGQPLMAQSNWVDFTDVTSTNIIGPSPFLTITDQEEKDIAIGDLNGDGKDDVVIVRKLPFSDPGARVNVILISHNNKLYETTRFGGFEIANIPDDARDVAIFDANGDGKNDILTVNTFGEQPRLFINTGNLERAFPIPQFQEDTNFMVPWNGPFPHFCAVAVGDIDNDNDMDLFFSDYSNDLEDRLCVNDGKGFFTDVTDTRMTAEMSESAFGTGCVIDDFNKDGWNDIVKISTLFSPQVLRMLINDGTGNFGSFQDLPFDAVYMIEKADFNNDERMDLYVESDGQDYMLINQSTNRDGTVVWTSFDVTNSDKTSGFGGNVRAGDVDNDGFVDFAVADVDVDIPGHTRRMCILKNMGGTSLQDPNNPTNLDWNVQGTYDVAWIDVNQDGKLDLLVGGCFGLQLFFQD